MFNMIAIYRIFKIVCRLLLVDKCVAKRVFEHDHDVTLSVFVNRCQLHQATYNIQQLKGFTEVDGYNCFSIEHTETEKLLSFHQYTE